MTLARKDPLEPGVYWIDLFNDAAESGERIFDAWQSTNGDAVAVHSKQRDTTIPNSERVFTVFSVKKGLVPVFAFPRTKLGSPTVQKLASAPGGITPADLNVKSDDTVRKPEPRGLGDELSDSFLGSPTFAWAIILGLYVYLSKGNRR